MWRTFPESGGDPVDAMRDVVNNLRIIHFNATEAALPYSREVYQVEGCRDVNWRGPATYHNNNGRCKDVLVKSI
jgi:hypothetical protein